MDREAWRAAIHGVARSRTYKGALSLMVGERSGFSCKEEEPRQNLVLTLRSGYSWESIEATQFEYKE